MGAWDEITTQLKAMEESIAGVTKAFAFDETPDSLASAILPAFNNLPGAGEYLTAAQAEMAFGVGMATEVRQYEATIWYKPIQAPPDALRHAAGLQTLHDAAKIYFMARPQLEGQRYVLSARLVSDTGPMVTEYVTGSGNAYSACGFTIEVAYTTRITYAGGD